MWVSGHRSVHWRGVERQESIFALWSLPQSLFQILGWFYWAEGPFTLPIVEAICNFFLSFFVLFFVLLRSFSLRKNFPQMLFYIYIYIYFNEIVIWYIYIDTILFYRIKCKTDLSKFFQISFQFSNFVFVYFSSITFKFIQLRLFYQLLLYAVINFSIL